MWLNCLYSAQLIVKALAITKLVVYYTHDAHLKKNKKKTHTDNQHDEQI